jgi:hypothetical protein
MKKITITADRLGGKTKMLSDSIVTHMLDPNLKPDLRLVVTAPYKVMLDQLRESVRDKMPDVPGFKYVITGTSSYIELGKRRINFLMPQMQEMIGREMDYLFVDNIDLMPKGFQDFLDAIVRPYIVVIQTASSPETKFGLAYQSNI